MGVVFVYRSHYEGPTGKYVRRFDDETVLDWFRARWRGASDGRDAAQTAIGTHVYGLGSLFEAIAEHDLEAPTSGAELRELLGEHLYVEGEILQTTHCLQVITDDDELELAYYLFDDAFLAKYGAKAAFLLHEEVELPTDAGASGYEPRTKTKALKPKGDGEGAVYLAFLAYYDSCNLVDLEGAVRIDGIRLPALRDHLVSAEPTDAWPFELKLVRSQLDGDRSLGAGLGACARFAVAAITNSVPTSELGLGGLRSAADELNALRTDARFARAGHDPEKSLVQSDEHVAQLCLHTDRWGVSDLYHRWILFDDLWAEANPNLAEAILRYAARWDVLS